MTTSPVSCTTQELPRPRQTIPRKPLPYTFLRALLVTSIFCLMAATACSISHLPQAKDIPSPENVVITTNQGNAPIYIHWDEYKQHEDQWPYADHFRVSWAVRKYPGYLSYLEDMDKVKELKCPEDGRSSSSSQPSHQTSQSIKTRTGSEVVRGHRMNLTKHGIAAFPSPLQLEATGRTEESIDIRIKSPHGVSEAVYCVSACTTVYIEYEDKENTSEETQCSEYRESATARYPEGNFHIKFVRDDGHTAEWTGADVYSDTGLHPGTLYRYEATACNNLGCSRARDVAGITEVAGETDLPNPPAYVRGKEVRGDVEISWSHVKGATYYKVNDNVESPQSHSPYYPHVSAPLTSYIDSSPNRTYTGLSFISGDLLPTTYSVKACNKTGCSESSPTFTIR